MMDPGEWDIVSGKRALNQPAKTCSMLNVYGNELKQIKNAGDPAFFIRGY